MKNIVRIFVRDVRKIWKVPFAVVVLLGIMILPSLYAWFNIAASWDPYGNTKGIQVAVANLDQGIELEGAKVNIGGMIIDNLAKNDQIGWVFVDSEEAHQGVESGKYYAAVILPEDFSKKISSVLSDDIKKPQIDYYVNQKRNAIAPKITDKGVGVIQQQVNETFVSTVTEVIGTLLQNTDQQLQDGGAVLVEKIVQKLQQTDQSLLDLGTSLETVKHAGQATSELLSVIQSSLPDASEVMGGAADSLSGAQQTIDASKIASIRLIDTVAQVTNSIELQHQNTETQIAEAMQLVKVDRVAAQTLLLNAKESVYRVIEFNQKLLGAIDQINDGLPSWLKLTGLEKLHNRLEISNQKQNELITAIDHTIEVLQLGSDFPIEVQQSLNHALLQAKSSLSDGLNQYRTEVSPDLQNVISNTYDTIGKFSSLLNAMGNDLPEISNSLNGVNAAMEQNGAMLDNTIQNISSAREQIQQILSEINAVGEDEKLEKLLELIRRDPNTTAGFFSAPVELNTVNLYNVENYGSALSPFYTILCLWVGALILAAILKCKVQEDTKIHHLKAYEIYFGRYLLFLLVGVLQALIACLGDLYLLKIQCENPALFVLAGVVSSVVFTNIVYTLTISFGDVGKAIAVILLVIQVAGAGGTFPIEVMPQFFQNVNPLLPFTHGINAMRETVAGMYQYAYWWDLLKVVSYLPISLFIGLCLRKLFIQLNHFCEEKLEETGVM